MKQQCDAARTGSSGDGSGSDRVDDNRKSDGEDPEDPEGEDGNWIVEGGEVLEVVGESRGEEGI